MNEVALRWGWLRTGDFTYNTPAGPLDLETDGRATLRHAAIDGWKAYLLRRDKRCAREGRASELGALQRRPVTEVHERWAATNWQQERIALGAAMDHRSRAWLSKKKPTDGTPPEICPCGVPEPTRRHWMWECPAAGAPFATSDIPTEEDSIEHSLGVPMLAYTPPSPPIDTSASAVLVRALRQDRQADGTPILIASDGGVQDPTRPRYRAGAFGVAMARRDGSLLSFVRWTCGMDQTSFMAELQGAITVLASAAEAQTPIHLIIDNKAVQRGVAARLRGARPVVQFCGRLWRIIDGFCEQLPLGCLCSWVPAHGRHLDWDAGRPPATAQAWRALNDAADSVASAEAVNRWQLCMRTFAASEAVARAKATQVLCRLLRAEESWASQWFQS